MADRNDELPPGEKCCVAALRANGIPNVRQAFTIHALQHGLECDRYADLWARELLIEAVAGFATAHREAGNTHLATEEGFVAAARAAWAEAGSRSGRAG